MDPTATLAAMNAALDAGDIETAREHARALLDWLDHGGFPPAGITADEARQAARFVLRHEA